MARINSAGVFIELIAAVSWSSCSASHRHPRPTVLVRHPRSRRGHEPRLLRCVPHRLAGLAPMSCTASTPPARWARSPSTPAATRPRAILRPLVASFIIGGLILLFAMLAVPDLADRQSGRTDCSTSCSHVLGWPDRQIVLLVAVVIAITVCALAVHTAAIRLMFAMARDNDLPGASRLAQVEPALRTPVVPAVMIGVVAVLHPRGQHQLAGDLLGGHQHRDHHDLHRLSAGDGADARSSAARRVAGPGAGKAATSRSAGGACRSTSSPWCGER